MSTSDRGNSQKYFKYNYIDQVQHLVPELYDELDFRLYGEEEDVNYAVLGKLLRAIKHIDGLLPVSGNTETSTLYQYYLPENKLTRVTPQKFSEKILRADKKQWSDFKNQGEFLHYVSGSLLPKIRANDAQTSWASGVSSYVDRTTSDAGLVQQYLVDHLGLLYFLNTSGGPGLDPPSALITSALGDVFYGDTFDEEAGTKLLFEYFWLNRETSAGFQEYLPHPWNQVSAYQAGNYTSGTQMLESLKTLIGTWTTQQDENSLFLKDSLELSILGQTPKRMESKGAMAKFLKAIAYGFYDIKSLVTDIGDLLDIERCPSDFLDYLAHYVGWKLLTDDVDKWRNQLRQAIYVYKSKGTRNSIDYVLNELIPSSIFDPNNTVSGVTETWESYLPNLMYYLIRTASPVSKDMTSLQATVNDWRDYANRNNLDIPVHMGTDIDSSCRFLVDALLHYLHINHGMIRIGNIDYTETPFWTNQPDPSYFHRGKHISVPPWEHDRFYLNSRITPRLVLDLSGFFQSPTDGFGLQVPSGIVGQFATLLRDVVEVKDDGDTPLAWGDNQAFKFFTSSQQLAPNYKEIIAEGDIESASLLDYWNSKSSTVFTKLDAANIDFEETRLLYSEATNKIGNKAIDTIVDVLRQFAPFHVINKIYVGQYMDDKYMIPQRRDFLKYEDASSFGAFDHPGEGVCAVPDLNGGATLNVYAPSGYTYYGLNTSGNYITTGVSATVDGDARYMEWNTSSVTRNNMTGNTEAGVPPAAHTTGANLRFNFAPSVWGVPDALEMLAGPYTLKYEVFDPGYAITGNGDTQIYNWNASTPISSLLASELPPSGFVSWTSQSSLDPANNPNSFPLTTSAVGVYEVSGYMIPWHTTNPDRKGDPYFNIEVSEPLGSGGVNAVAGDPRWGGGLNFSGLKIGNFELLGEFETGWMFDKDYQNDGIRPSSIESIAILTEDTDYETNIMDSYSVCSFRGTSGNGIFSGIGHASSFAAPQQGRFMPSASWYGAKTGAGAEELFWGVAQQTTGELEAVRDTSRRRNLRYALPSYPHTRTGFGDVMSTDYMSISGMNPLRGKTTPSGYLAKGFDFSANQFYSVTGGYSGVYDSKPTDTLSGVPASSYQWSRGVADMEVNGSSIATWRDQMGSNIMRSIIDIFLRRGKLDARWLRFDEDFILDFKFGTQVNMMYSRYIREYGRQLRNYIDGENPFAGGRNIIAHAFGPLLENHNFSLSGHQHIYGGDLPAFPGQESDTINNKYPHWHTVFGGGVGQLRHGYYNVTGGEVRLGTGQFVEGAVNTYISPADAEEGAGFNKTIYANSTLLSGIEIVGCNTESFIIANQLGPNGRISSNNPKSLTFHTKKPRADKRDTTRLRWKLDGGRNLFTNGDLRHPPRDVTLGGKMTSSVAGWVTRDANRDENMVVSPTYSASGNDALDSDYATTGGIFLRTFSAISKDGFLEENGPELTSPFSRPQAVTDVQAREEGVNYGEYSTKGFHITFSGQEGSRIGSQVGYAHCPTIETKVSLKPSTTYQLTFDLSANQRYAFFPTLFWNKTKNQISDSNYTTVGTWLATSATHLKDIGINHSDGGGAFKNPLWWLNSSDLGGGVPLTSNWRKRGYTITTPSNFEPSDDVTFIGFPSYDSDSRVYRMALANFELLEITPDEVASMQYSPGVQGNRLNPDTFYKMKVTGSKTNENPGGDQHLHVRLVTEPTPLVGHGVPNTRWGWSWDERMWEPCNIHSDKQWKTLAFTSSALETHVLDFNTKNYRTPYHYNALASGVNHIHTSSTAYYLEICRTETGPRSNEFVYNGVDLASVEIRDMDLGKLLEDYTKNDFFTVFKYFDDLGASKLSRDSNYSQDEYGTSGGSRSEYMEFFGGSTSAAPESVQETVGKSPTVEDAIYNFIEDEG